MAKPNIFDSDEVFRRVFAELHIPMMAIDLKQLPSPFTSSKKDTRTLRGDREERLAP